MILLVESILVLRLVLDSVVCYARYSEVMHLKEFFCFFAYLGNS